MNWSLKQFLFFQGGVSGNDGMPNPEQTRTELEKQNLFGE